MEELLEIEKELDELHITVQKRRSDSLKDKDSSFDVMSQCSSSVNDNSESPTRNLDSFKEESYIDIASQCSPSVINNSEPTPSPKTKEYTTCMQNNIEKPSRFEVKRHQLEYDLNSENVSRLGKNIFDSHCHLIRIFKQNQRRIRGLKKWEDSRKPPTCRPLETLLKHKSVKEDFASSFEGCITVCCDPINWKIEWYEWLTQENNVYLTYGCHPAKAKFYEDCTEFELYKLLSKPKVVALGEIGLDEICCNREKGPSMDTQIKVFKRQILVAIKTNMPIVIHLRSIKSGGEVWEKAKKIMVDCGLPSDWKIHMHCFNQSLENALDWLKDFPNMRFGFVPGNFMVEVARGLKLEYMLLETDAPYFIPSSSRRKKNVQKFSVPTNVIHVAAQIAEIRSIALHEVITANRENVSYIYGINQADDVDATNP